MVTPYTGGTVDEWSKEPFKPGDRVPSTGCYRCTHGNRHMLEHEVTVLFGEAFPACKTCGDKVRFELLRAAIHVRAHPHFQ